MTSPASFKDSDKLLISTDREIFAVDANMVAGIIETKQLHMLPIISSHPALGKTGFIKGVITQRGEVIVVISLENLFKAAPVQNGRTHRLVIIKKDASSLGIYVGAKELSFLWKEELSNLEFKQLKKDYIVGLIDPYGKKIQLLDCQKVLEEIHKAISGRQ